MKPCAFWAQNYLCSMTEGGGCGVCECKGESFANEFLVSTSLVKDDEIPKPWKSDVPPKV